MRKASVTLAFFVCALMGWCRGAAFAVIEQESAALAQELSTLGLIPWAANATPSSVPSPDQSAVGSSYRALIPDPRPLTPDP